MKILITGSFCSGKSTLASQLRMKLEDSILIKEHPRELLKAFKSIDWTIPELRDYLIVRQLYLEKKASLKFKSFTILDTGIISNIAHDKILNVYKKNRKKLIKKLDHSRYDLVFYCDHSEIDLIDDGERFTDRNLQNKLSHEIIKTLKDLDYENYITLKGSKEERLTKALEYISKWNRDEK